MSIDKVRAYFRTLGIEERILEFPVSSATVALAAEALHCDEAHIAKTLSFETETGCMLIVTAGDTKIDNPKFKARFQRKAKMLTHDQAEALTGHAVGGVCPFAVPENVPVYLDISMKRFDAVYPACGSSNSAIRLTLDELEAYAKAAEWIDVCKIKDPV